MINSIMKFGGYVYKNMFSIALWALLFQIIIELVIYIQEYNTPQTTEYTGNYRFAFIFMSLLLVLACALLNKVIDKFNKYIENTKHSLGFCNKVCELSKENRWVLLGYKENNLVAYKVPDDNITFHGVKKIDNNTPTSPTSQPDKLVAVGVKFDNGETAYSAVPESMISKNIQR